LGLLGSTFTTGFILPHDISAIHALAILTSYDERYIIMIFDEGTMDAAASFHLAHVAFATNKNSVNICQLELQLRLIFPLIRDNFTWVKPGSQK
jgi:hypothetical protein